MNNVLMRRIVLTADWQPLSSRDVEVATVDVQAPPSNAAPVLFQGDAGQEVPWIAGEYHTLVRVNLASLRAKGTPGDVLTLVGGSW
jgi:hypothetical protein